MSPLGTAGACAAARAPSARLTPPPLKCPVSCGWPPPATLPVHSVDSETCRLGVPVPQRLQRQCVSCCRRCCCPSAAPPRPLAAASEGRANTEAAAAVPARLDRPGGSSAPLRVHVLCRAAAPPPCESAWLVGWVGGVLRHTKPSPSRGGCGRACMLVPGGAPPFPSPPPHLQTAVLLLKWRRLTCMAAVPRQGRQPGSSALSCVRRGAAARGAWGRGRGGECAAHMQDEPCCRCWPERMEGAIAPWPAYQGCSTAPQRRRPPCCGSLAPGTPAAPRDVLLLLCKGHSQRHHACQARETPCRFLQPPAAAGRLWCVWSKRMGLRVWSP